MDAKRIKKIRKGAAERVNKRAFIQFRIEPQHCRPALCRSKQTWTARWFHDQNVGDGAA
jgi:hypothetical protein